MHSKGKNSTLYVSDMDGTLMGADSTISAASVEMLNDVISRGALFTVATARTPATVHTLLADVDLTIPAIVMTGGAHWDKLTKEFSNIQFFPEEMAKKIVDIYIRHEMPSFLYTFEDGKIVMYHIGEMNAIEREFADERIGNPYKRQCFEPVGHLPETLDKVMLLFGTRPDEMTRPVYEELSRLNVNPMFYHDMFGPENAILEVFPASCSKDQGIRRMMERVGASRLVVFGDNMNDIPMLKAADVAVAVENAIPEVKDVADVVIGPNTDDAVARFIYNDFMKNQMTAQ